MHTLIASVLSACIFHSIGVWVDKAPTTMTNGEIVYNVPYRGGVLLGVRDICIDPTVGSEFGGAKVLGFFPTTR
jgi:hypothetical protein